MTLKDIVGANVRAARKARGWSRELLAEKANVSETTVGKIERGDVGSSFDTLEALAKALDIHPTALFAAEPPVAPTPERQKALTRLQVKLTRCTDDQLAAAEKAVRIVLE